MTPNFNSYFLFIRLNVKSIISILICLFLSFDNQAQNNGLPTGSIAPDHTFTDLNGDTHNLYDILEEGKAVIIQISFIACTPCWDYVNNGILNSIHENFGEDGTDELRVFFFEGSEGTDAGCLISPDSCNVSSPGNWIDNAVYPMTNDDEIAYLFNTSIGPSLFTICPNKEITNFVYDIPSMNDLLDAVFICESFNIIMPSFVIVESNNTINVIDQSENATMWEWSWGDGSPNSFGENPEEHIYTENGIYTICLTASNENSSNEVCEEIEISFLPEASIYSNVNNNLVTIINASLNDIGYNWTINGEPNISESPTFYATENGIIEVCLMVSNNYGEDEICEEILIEGLPEAAFTYELINGEVVFTNTSSNANNYTWTFGDGGTSIEQNPNYTYAINDEYEVCLTATNDVGENEYCETIAVSIVGINDAVFNNITVKPNPATNFVNVEFSQFKSSIKNIEIINIAGQSVRRVSAQELKANTQITIDLADLAEGIYLVNFTTDEGLFSQKLVIGK